MPEIRTSELNVGYLESGPRDGPTVLLLHGFPDDATSWSAVMEQLSAQGYRCVAPFLRGVGPTTFLDVETPRAGDVAALGSDVLHLLEAMDLRNVIVVGQDWGSPVAETAAAFAPERVRRPVALLPGRNWQSSERSRPPQAR